MIASLIISICTLILLVIIAIDLASLRKRIKDLEEEKGDIEN